MRQDGVGRDAQIAIDRRHQRFRIGLLGIDAEAANVGKQDRDGLPLAAQVGQLGRVHHVVDNRFRHEMFENAVETRLQPQVFNAQFCSGSTEASLTRSSDASNGLCM